MAKKLPAAARPLAGKTVAFVGKFGYHDMHLERYHGYVTGAGATVVEPDAGTGPDYLVVGDGRGGKPPGDAAKLAKKFPAMRSLDVAGFCRLLVPDRDGLVADAARGKFPDAALLRDAGVGADLSGIDLRDRNLYGIELDGLGMDGADFRGAKLEYTRLPETLRGARLDAVTGEHTYLCNLDGCSFRNANLGEAWLFWGTANTVAGCDFTGARLAKASAHGTFTDCAFAGADLSDVDAEGSTFDRSDFTGADLSRLHASKGKFVRAVFAGAKLPRADLRDASLVGADLRNADLRDAVLGGADLTDASVDGADFTGAVLTGTKLGGVDTAKAKGLTAPAARAPGPKALELSAAAAGATSFQTTAEVDISPDEFARLSLSASARRGRLHAGGRSVAYRDGDETFDTIGGGTVEAVLLNLADRWPNATLRLDTVAAKGSKTVRGAKLLALARAAWAEAFGVDAPADDLEEKGRRQRAAAIRERDALVADIRARGAAVWNDIDFRAKKRYDLSGLDLSGANLPGIGIWGRKDLGGAKFPGADLTGAKLWSATFSAADFAGAKLSGVSLSHAECGKASFRGANLSQADLTATKLREADLRDADLSRANLTSADLRGADLTGAKLANATLDGVKHDAATKWPAGFVPPGGRIGAAPTPVVPGSLDFPTFVRGLAKQVEAGRLGNATAMLKAERFQLFAEVTADAVVGVVRSQSTGDRVYACRLAADGAFGCCTQNLRPCGGLGGKVCKHILVLVVGLAKADRLDPAAAAAWLDGSRGKPPAFDKDGMGDVFLKYKGAEAGEIDWRPTETLPEDFYAM